MPYAAEIFIRFSALILNCREEWLAESGWRECDQLSFHQQH